ncbi:MAG TPA: hypothetical protein VF950_21495 [Planctomycetota bacterium]
MSRGARAWILWTSALLGLVALAWMGAVVYVDVQAGREIAELQRTYRTSSGGRFERRASPFALILLRGCPALPRLVGALDPADDASYTATLSTLIHSIVTQSHGERTVSPEAANFRMRMIDLHIDVADPPEERERKIRELRRWWTEEGAARHPAWRFWTSGCPSPIVDPDPN